MAEKIYYKQLDYNLLRQFKNPIMSAALNRFGTIQISKEQFNVIYSELLENEIKNIIVKFYERFKEFEPVVTESDLLEYYNVNIAPIS